MGELHLSNNPFQAVDFVTDCHVYVAEPLWDMYHPGGGASGTWILLSKTKLFLTMVKSRITRSVSGTGVAEADMEVVVTVGIQSIWRGVENIESINIGFR